MDSGQIDHRSIRTVHITSIVTESAKLDNIQKDFAR